MLDRILDFSLKNKLIVILFTLTVVSFGIFSVMNISVGAVPDITNNQVQIITTSGNLSTQEVEQFITAPVEMEMANLPGVEEIRSVSKFGISLITVVFNDDMGNYLPRQLIAEKIKAAAGKIPEQYGEPEMGPITTGLGEIYQYTLDVKPGFESDFTATDLRTIQDWIVRRRLSGINGVVEINSWGGFLKQYEVSIDPQRLKSMDISLMEVYSALESNNSISGGAYIEKNNQSYFIRGDGGIKTIEDIARIPVRNENGISVLIEDVAKVRFGYANRYGAITSNGKGETILGQVMMLKDADSKNVINEVKRRIDEVRENLPEGIELNPIVDRSELVAKTTFTVAENLILGALIVMLTVILLMGNIRAALVIASMIPLALLFTLSMMYIFDIDANLMSLGALDFGIIIDGGVIIVEYISMKLSATGSLIHKDSNEKSSIMDKIAFEGSSKMMKSAIFGQLIILIVFIPVLSLRGVEGKMFQPMAISFCFAIIGAMIMGLTWLPVASALFLKPGKTKSKFNISEKFMNFAYRMYVPVMQWSCNHKNWVLGAAVISLVTTFLVFNKMGGEFVPTLDEGDFVIQPVLKTGTSLTKTVELTTRMEQILMKEFPEVDRIVSRIGAAEVPTDPMSMEEIDMIIRLKPRNTWTSADSKEELAEKFKEALSVIPGIDYEFTQPIEMRFNELITGVRSDIAIKIFGDDLNYMDAKANEIKMVVDKIEGAEDVIIEKTAGLPQIRIVYDRRKIAQYNIDISTINDYLSTAFGGKSAGVIFEGDKRFDLVVRFDKSNRADITDVEALVIPVSGARQIPLRELASISYTEGPAKISRENTHRRVVVSVNVRNRDLQSVVEDIQSKVEKSVVLKPGNYIEYGGQFENLQNATSRLMVAVPVALLLILIFLHFAFGSLKDALLIFTAIPLATVGGVFLLWFRGMPFSISAGVGFIALFGIAVLNGVVLIEHLKELKHTGLYSMRELILKGTKARLRPVLLTASAAAMGFLPMALSSGAGAEVQRPLATVVIGGLITSTLLTMIALPLLFEIFYEVIDIKLFPFRVIRKSTLITLLLLAVGGHATLYAQKQINLKEAVELGLKNNPEIKSGNLQVEAIKKLRRTAFDPDKTIISYGTDQNNIAENGYPLKVWSIEQQFRFPTVYINAAKVKSVEVALAEQESYLLKDRVIKDIIQQYIEIQTLTQKKLVVDSLESLYADLLRIAEMRYRKGEMNKLDMLSIKARQQQLNFRQSDLSFKIETAYRKLRTLMNYEENFNVSDSVELFVLPDTEITNKPLMKLPELQKKQADELLKLEKGNFLPDFFVRYFMGSNSFPAAKNYQGFEAGLAIPLFFNAQKSRIQAAKISVETSKIDATVEISKLKVRQQELLNERRKFLQMIDSYQESGKILEEEIIRTSLLSYRQGEIDFLKFVSVYEQALQIKLDYLDAFSQYNHYTLELIYFTR